MPRAGGRVEATGQPQFLKKFGSASHYWPNQIERGEEKSGDGSANRSNAALPPPKMTHGGARVGAGRKRSANEQLHREREKFTKRCPVQVTLKMKPDIKNLRRRDVYRKIEACLRQASTRADAPICDFSVVLVQLRCRDAAAMPRCCDAACTRPCP